MTEPQVVEAGPRRRITVVQEDIDRAFRGSSGKCVVSRAIARTIPDVVRVETDSQTIRFTRGGQRWVYLTPPAVQGYVQVFDAGDPVEPFSFTLSRNIAVKQLIPTEVGKKVDRARNQVQTAKRRVVAQKVKGAPKKAVIAAEKELVSVQQAYETAKKEAKGKIQRKSNGAPKAESRIQPRVRKTGARNYGARLMRINQDSKR